MLVSSYGDGGILSILFIGVGRCLLVYNLSRRVLIEIIEVYLCVSGLIGFEVNEVSRVKCRSWL